MVRLADAELHGIGTVTGVDGKRYYVAWSMPGSISKAQWEDETTIRLATAEEVELARQGEGSEPDADEQTTPEEARRQLTRMGLPVDHVSDQAVLELLSQIMRTLVPAPAVPAGSPPVNGRAWLAAALTAGGFRRPEDRKQTADLGDGGEIVDLGILALVVMRHLANARPPRGMSDEFLAVDAGAQIDHLRRTQAVLDEVSEEIDRPAKLGPRWWES